MHAERERESAAERDDPTTALNQSVEGGDRDLTFHLWPCALLPCERKRRYPSSIKNARMAVCAIVFMVATVASLCV